MIFRRSPGFATIAPTTTAERPVIRIIASGCLLSLLAGVAPRADAQNVADSARLMGGQADSAWANRKTLSDSERVVRLSVIAADLYKRARDHRGEAQARYLAARAYQTLERPDSALAYYRQALPLSRLAGDRAGEAAVLNWTAGLFQFGGSLDSALAYSRQALVIHRERANPGEQAATLNSIGMAHYAMARADSALAAFRAALPLRRDAGDRMGEG